MLEDDGDVKESQRARCARDVLAIFEVAYAEWKALGDSNCDPRPRGLERFDRGMFTGTHIHLHVVLIYGHLHRLCPHPHAVQKGADALGALKEYDRELEVLEDLLRVSAVGGAWEAQEMVRQASFGTNKVL